MPESIVHRLLVLVGLSPQVISGALHVLMVQEKKVVDRMNILTTPEGGLAVRNTFFLGHDNPLDRFCRDYGFSRKKILFTDADLHVIWPGRGLQNVAETAALDRLFSLLAGWTHPGAAPIVACVAGGRKDMGVLFSQVFSLLARPEDRLVHLLTSEEFANLGDFFYPPPQSIPIAAHRLGHGVAFLNSGDARMELVDIPLVRLRPLLDEETRKGLVGLEIARERVQHEIAGVDPAVWVSLRNLSLRYRGQETKLPPKEFAVWLFFGRARQQGDGERGDGWILARELDHSSHVERMERCYQEVIGKGSHGDQHSFIPRTRGGDVDYPELKTKMTHSISKIKRRLGESHPAKIGSRTARGGREYGLLMAPDHIHIDEE